MKGVGTSKRSTHCECDERVQHAADLLVNHAGRRLYQLETLFIERFRCSRATARRYVSRARAKLAEGHNAALRDLASSLPAKFAIALERARDCDDGRTEARLLDSLLKLAGAAEQREPDAGPIGIDLVVVESPRNNDGKAKTNK